MGRPKKGAEKQKSLAPVRKRSSITITAPDVCLDRAPKNHIAANTAADYNAKYVNHIRGITAIAQTVDREDPETLRNAFYAYLALCEQNEMKVGNQAAFLSMGISRDTAYQWKVGQKRAGDPRYRELMEQVFQVCSVYREALAEDGRMHPAISIFQMKNFDGLSDSPAVSVQIGDPLGERKTPAQIVEQYGDSLIEE